MNLIRRISVDSFLKPLNDGISRPILILGSDYKKYILKNEKVNDNGTLTNFNCMFLNELMAFQLGQYLGVPMPEAAIAYLEDIFIENDPTIRFAYRYREGYYFASEELENLENNFVDNINDQIKMGKPYIKKTWNSFFDNIVNKEEIAVILAFDLLIGNFDRYSNEGNLLISETELGRKIFAIDHGHAFWGPIWDTQKINYLNINTSSATYANDYIDFVLGLNIRARKIDGLGNMFKALECYVSLENINVHSFQNIVERIESITENLLDDFINSIPEGWFVNKVAQTGYYKRFILNQKDSIRNIIQNLCERGAFTNYRGGILEWKKEKQFGTV